MSHSRKRFVTTLLVGIVLLGGLLARMWGAARKSDPVVNGRPMSEWAFSLIGPGFQKNSYFVPREYMAAFARDRSAAIRSLDHVINWRPSRVRTLWMALTRKLPGKMGERLRPRGRLIANRWAAVLALSKLAREEPDRRIAEILLNCMKHENAAVRKVAAYEAGPWLWPEDPGFAARILEAGLNDIRVDVRRDACRRIAASATNSLSPYSQAVRPLWPRVRELAAGEFRAETELRAALLRAE